MITSIVLSFILIYEIDKRLNTVLNNYIDEEIERISSKIINEALDNTINTRNEKVSIIERNENNEIEKISYNTKYINNLRNELSKRIEENIKKIESGELNKYNLEQQKQARERYVKYKNGLICEINVNSLQGSTLFGNIGPVIPIKLSFIGYSYVRISNELKDYGINNVMIQTNLEIELTNLITMPISSKTHKTKMKIPISIEMIKGDIPNYYNDFYSKKNN